MDVDKLIKVAEIFEEATEAYAPTDDELIKMAPNWAQDEDKWEKAKKIIQKSKTYKGKPKKDLWPLIAKVYLENLGGRKKKKEKNDK